MGATGWGDDLQVLGAMAPEAAAEKLRELGNDEAAERLLKGPTDASFTDEGDPPWKHTSHAFGFLAPGQAGAQKLPIKPVGTIPADNGLKNVRLNIALNRLVVADYPGDDTHLILFEFHAENQVAGSVEGADYNIRLRGREGGQVGLVNLPIFTGLNVGNNGLSLKCRTVNVGNEDDERLLSFLNSDTFKSGLKFVSTLQPALAPLSQMVVGLTTTIAGRRRNVLVQDFTMGLDFGNSPTGARLALGDYVVVQVPGTGAQWDWAHWEFHPSIGEIVAVADPTKKIPYNYMIFSISRYGG